MLESSATIKAVGKLQNKGVKISNTTVQPGFIWLIKGSKPNAPPETVKKIIPTSGRRLIFFAMVREFIAESLFVEV